MEKKEPVKDEELLDEVKYEPRCHECGGSGTKDKGMYAVGIYPCDICGGTGQAPPSPPDPPSPNEEWRDCMAQALVDGVNNMAEDDDAPTLPERPPLDTVEIDGLGRSKEIPGTRTLHREHIRETQFYVAGCPECDAAKAEAAEWLADLKAQGRVDRDIVVAAGPEGVATAKASDLIKRATPPARNHPEGTQVGTGYTGYYPDGAKPLPETATKVTYRTSDRMSEDIPDVGDEVLVRARIVEDCIPTDHAIVRIPVYPGEDYDTGTADIIVPRDAIERPALLRAIDNAEDTPWAVATERIEPGEIVILDEPGSKARSKGEAAYTHSWEVEGDLTLEPDAAEDLMMNIPFTAKKIEINMTVPPVDLQGIDWEKVADLGRAILKTGKDVLDYTMKETNPKALDALVFVMQTLHDHLEAELSKMKEKDIYGIAGEDLESGDIIYPGADGKIYVDRTTQKADPDIEVGLGDALSMDEIKEAVKPSGFLTPAEESAAGRYGEIPPHWTGGIGIPPGSPKEGLAKRLKEDLEEGRLKIDIDAKGFAEEVTAPIRAAVDAEKKAVGAILWDHAMRTGKRLQENHLKFMTERLLKDHPELAEQLDGRPPWMSQCRCVPILPSKIIVRPEWEEEAKKVLDAAYGKATRPEPAPGTHPSCGPVVALPYDPERCILESRLAAQAKSIETYQGEIDDLVTANVHLQGLRAAAMAEVSRLNAYIVRLKVERETSDGGFRHARKEIERLEMKVQNRSWAVDHNAEIIHELRKAIIGLETKNTHLNDALNVEMGKKERTEILLGETARARRQLLDEREMLKADVRRLGVKIATMASTVEAFRTLMSRIPAPIVEMARWRSSLSWDEIRELADEETLEEG